MTKDEALRMALEALEKTAVIFGDDSLSSRAAEAVKEALAQPEQNQFNPDWDAMAVMVEEQQRMAAEVDSLKWRLNNLPVSGTYTTGVMAERQRIVNLLMIQHEMAKGAHNYWNVAAQLIQADVGSDT